MSVAIDIGAALVTGLRAATFVVSTGPTVNLPDERIVRRKFAEVPQGGAVPQIIVVVGEDAETERLTATAKLKRWRVAVVIVTATGGQLQDDARLRDWRDTVDAVAYDAQRATFASVTGFNEVRATGRSPFDAQAAGRDYVFSTQNYEVQVIEGSL